MAKITVNDRVNALSDEVRQELIDGAIAGKSITEMSKRLRIEYHVVQRLLWQSGTLPWRGAKVIISRRLRSLRAASRRDDRDRLVREVEEQVDYLYYAARQLQDKFDKVKNVVVELNN